MKRRLLKKDFYQQKVDYLRSCTILNKGLPKEQKSERKGVGKVKLDGYGNHRQVRPRASS